MAGKKNARKPNKLEIATMQVHSALGESDHAIAKKIGRSNHTVRKYLNSEFHLNDPIVKELVMEIKAREVEDLSLISAKARNRLHELLDESKLKAIETTAILDRTFQQRRLLEGASTENLNVRSVVGHLMEQRKEIERRMEQLRAKKEKI